MDASRTVALLLDCVLNLVYFLHVGMLRVNGSSCLAYWTLIHANVCELILFRIVRVYLGSVMRNYRWKY
jgi:hypothetical protein